jgi:hypothetical protein
MREVGWGRVVIVVVRGGGGGGGRMWVYISKWKTKKPTLIFFGRSIWAVVEAHGIVIRGGWG